MSESFVFEPETISELMQVPKDNVEKMWPLVIEALKSEEIDSDACRIAALATIGVEVPKFYPINEYGGSAYFEKHYGKGTRVGTRLGNTEDGDGARYHGRGLIQITGRSNYRTYGTLLGIDLEEDPELALDPGVSAKILALYFSRHQVKEKAEAGDWQGVRRAVNGGLNGWDKFFSLVELFRTKSTLKPDKE